MPAPALASQAGRYLVVGTLAFAIDYGVTRALVAWLPLLVANSIGFLVANAFNFLAAHRWVFGHSFDRAIVARAYGAVLGVSVVGLLINDAVVWTWVAWLGWPLFPGKALATLVAMAWNFMARRAWVY